MYCYGYSTKFRAAKPHSCTLLRPALHGFDPWNCCTNAKFVWLDQVVIGDHFIDVSIQHWLPPTFFHLPWFHDQRGLRCEGLREAHLVGDYFLTTAKVCCSFFHY